MVRLSKIYTKTGDDGTTGLATGGRVRKDDIRVECYGTVDEANAAIGVACVEALRAGTPVAREIHAELARAQHDLFDLGADLATPVAPDEPAGSRLRIEPSQTLRLERTIDRFNENLQPLNSFVLPGGTPLAAALHVARTVVRRAERHAVTLQAQLQAGDSGEPKQGFNVEAVKYLNRLSDLLFVFGRVANDGGKSDVLWVPGANRGG
ncbi:MAG: cob(I)yrinic acid a,c-diamide adenosyltransferase [Planctomycetota bacterium]|nr:cob(I)yrinic acid a,c-diamide adenosyltransferase [Planctomycetota bacterium]